MLVWWPAALRKILPCDVITAATIVGQELVLVFGVIPNTDTIIAASVVNLSDALCRPAAVTHHCTRSAGLRPIYDVRMLPVT